MNDLGRGDEMAAFRPLSAPPRRGDEQQTARAGR